MSNGISRRVLLSSVLAGFATGACAGAPSTSLRPQKRPKQTSSRDNARIRALVDQAQLGGDVAFSVVDVKTGLELESYDAARALPPASVSKSITALYALETLGEGYRFTTRVYATGPIEGGVVKGDLVLAGGGDPVLDTDDLADMAARLKGAGVTRVEGRLRPWGGALPYARVVDNGQPEYVGYNPSVSGLNLNFNRVHFEWKRSGSGYAITMQARTKRHRPNVTVSRMTLADRRSPVYSYRDGGDHDAWSVARRALGGNGARWLPVRKPDAYAAEVFVALAKAQGISVTLGKAVQAAPSGAVIVSHQSPPMVKILKDMLKFSNNLTAELVGMTATAKRMGRALNLAASSAAMSSWADKALGLRGAKLVDHSGLGVNSKVPATSLAVAMARVHSAGRLQPILKPFLMKFENGQVNRNHPVKVQAKTGTLYFVSTLSGYATAPDGSQLAFAILTANQGKRRGIDFKQASRPQGSSSWNRRSKRLQQKLIERWAQLYGS